MASDTPRTLEQRLAEWASQPGAVVTAPERTFIALMRNAAASGVGYGWMQQVIEWEWQSKGLGALGPEYAERERRKAKAERDELKALLREVIRRSDYEGQAAVTVATVERIRAALEEKK